MLEGCAYNQKYISLQWPLDILNFKLKQSCIENWNSVLVCRLFFFVYLPLSLSIKFILLAVIIMFISETTVRILILVTIMRKHHVNLINNLPENCFLLSINAGLRETTAIVQCFECDHRALLEQINYITQNNRNVIRIVNKIWEYTLVNDILQLCENKLKGCFCSYFVWNGHFEKVQDDVFNRFDFVRNSTYIFVKWNSVVGTTELVYTLYIFQSVSSVDYYVEVLRRISR